MTVVPDAEPFIDLRDFLSLHGRYAVPWWGDAVEIPSSGKLSKATVSHQAGLVSRA